MSRLIVCKMCKRTRKHNAKGLCVSCYSKKYMREYHAEFERKRRKDKAEHIRSLEKIRAQTPKRMKWKQEYHQEYYKTNREKLLEYQRNYRRADPERRDNYKRRSIARRRGLLDTLTVDEWKSLLEKFKHCCAYCGKKHNKLEREHKIPASKGGGYTVQNIVPACPTCNRRKKDMTDKEFRVYLKRYPR